MLILGGNALKKTRRYQRDEFDTLTKFIQPKLEGIFGKVAMPPFYSTKESFGDADFVCSYDKEFDVRSKLVEIFNPLEISRNSDVFSININDLQIDIILCPAKKIHTLINYLSFNDLGNLIGRISKARFGLKYGQEGLTYPIWYQNQKLGEITVSIDYEKIHDFLDLSYSKYNQGFKTLLEIFNFVIASKYFNPFDFELEKLNRINRERNYKRKTYMSFLEYIRPMKGKYSPQPFAQDLGENFFIHKIDTAFPESLLVEKYNELVAKEGERKILTEKFNGHVIMQHFEGFSGKTLGSVFSKFKKSCDYDSLLQTESRETLLKLFGEFIKKQTKSNENIESL